MIDKKMSLGSFLWDRKVYFFFLLLQCILLTILFYVFLNSVLGTTLALITVIVSSILPLLHEYYNKKYFFKNLLKLELNSFQDPQDVEGNGYIEGEIFKEYLGAVIRNYATEIELRTDEVREYKDFIEMWVHEVKTPISSMTLSLSRETPKISDLKIDLRRLENEVERILYYSKKDTLEKDYRIKRTNLRNMVQEAIKMNSNELISNSFKINMENLEETVYTDEKWLKFILNQLIGNAIKYKNSNPTLSFSSVSDKNKVILSISDNGKGIHDDELSSIFKKGFTGSNGNEIKSTGFGLYIVKSLTDKLGLSISCINHPNTTFLITFPVSEHNNMLGK